MTPEEARRRCAEALAPHPGRRPIGAAPRAPQRIAVPIDPSAIGKATNFARAAAAHVAAGRPVASDATVEARFARCRECPLFAAGKAPGTGVCNHKSCGCSLRRVGVVSFWPNKLQWAEQACPIGRWSAVAAGE